MSSLRVLLVEDNPLNKELACDLLEYRGHKVTVAADVDQARRQLDSGPFDIALIDIHIPGGGGVALLKEMRGKPAFKELAAVAVTANAMTGDQERLIRDGFDGYIGKPIDTRTFVASVEAIFQGKSGKEK